MQPIREVKIHNYLAHAHSAYGKGYVFSFCPSVHRGVGGGCLGKCTIQLMSQGMSTFLLQKCSCLWRGGGGSRHMHYLANVPKKVLMPSNILGCHAISSPVISLLTCCQKEVLKACTCLYSQAARHSGILPPPLLGMSTIWLMSQGMSTFWLRTCPPPPGDELFLAYQREVCNRYLNCLFVKIKFHEV